MKRFPVLSLVASLLRALGWFLTVGATAIRLVRGLLEPTWSGRGLDLEAALAFAFGFAGWLLGLITVAIGESIGVLFAIEENTRRTEENRREEGVAR